MKKIKETLLLAILMMTANIAWAQGPNNSGTYYKSADGQKGQALKTALFQIIRDPDVTSYKGLIDAYKKTDVRDDGYLRDWYSKTTHYVPGSGSSSYKKEGDAYNREHSMPQSWFNEASPMKSDIVHVIPTDGYVNNRRSSYPFGEVGDVEWSSNGNYCKLGKCKTPGYSGKVFEPGDDIKGDIARIYFYMTTCYQDRILNWTSGTANNVIGGSQYQPLKEWVMTMMLRWAKEDPVDEVETKRNNAVYTVQKNRNPFVDYPELEDYVWGTKKNQAFSYDKYDGTPSNPDTPDNPETPDDPEDPENPDNPENPEKPDTIPSVSGGEIAFGSEFFNCDWTGTRKSNAETELTGTKNGITVTYAKGSSANMYCSAEQIRLYAGNQLTISSAGANIVALEFDVIDSSKELLSNYVGTIDGYNWTGDAKEIMFSAESGSGHIKMKGVKVSLRDNATGIISRHSFQFSTDKKRNLGEYNLKGQQLKRSGNRNLRHNNSRSLSRDIIIRNGRKVLNR